MLYGDKVGKWLPRAEEQGNWIKCKLRKHGVWREVYIPKMIVVIKINMLLNFYTLNKLFIQMISHKGFK